MPCQKFLSAFLKQKYFEMVAVFENSIIRSAIEGTLPNQLRLHLSMFLLNMMLHSDDAEFLLAKTQNKIKTINLSHILS